MKMAARHSTLSFARFFSPISRGILKDVEQMSAAETDLWVFRNGRKSVAGLRLLNELHAALKQLLDSSASQIRERSLNVLIRAGELESALADAASPAASPLASLTDALAFTLLSGDLRSV